MTGSKLRKFPYGAKNRPEGEKYGEASTENPPAEPQIVQRGKNTGKQTREIHLRSPKLSRGGKIQGSKYGKSPYEAPNCPEEEN